MKNRNEKGQFTNHFGELHPQFKGRIKRTGYWFIFKPEHPSCGKQHYVAEHRLIMEKHIGRFLMKSEVVHHINRIITDNRIENLQLFSSHGQHTKFAHPEVAIKSRKLNWEKRLSRKTEFKKGMTAWNKRQLRFLFCKHCGKKYYRQHKTSFCSHECAAKASKTVFFKGQIPWNKGHQWPKEIREKMRLAAMKRWHD